MNVERQTLRQHNIRPRCYSLCDRRSLLVFKSPHQTDINH